MKRIKTKSGADYIVYKDGHVRRPENDIEIIWTVDSHQYGEGFLDDLHNSYETIKIGNRIVWWGVHGDFAERIYSSLVDTIEEE